MRRYSYISQDGIEAHATGPREITLRIKFPEWVKLSGSKCTLSAASYVAAALVRRGMGKALNKAENF